MTKRRRRNGMDQDPLIHNQRKMDIQIAGVYHAERLNVVLSDNWKSFAGQIYFNRHGVFLSMVWSGILLSFATIILATHLKMLNISDAARISIYHSGTFKLHYSSDG
ncbi:transmembrane protein 18, partial [Tanacetum coccineum]